MSLFGGLLLFDIADPSIGNWGEDLSTRGLFDRWKTQNKEITLIINIDEDSNTNEVWIHDNKGNWETLFYGNYNDAIIFSKKFMQKNKKVETWEDIEK